MTFYQILQMDPSLVKREIKKTDDPKLIRKLKLGMFTRSLLIVIFAVVFIALMTTLFGSANSAMAVSIFCMLLAVKYVGYGYNITDSLIGMFFVFLILTFAPVAASMVNPFWKLVIYFCSIFMMLLIACENPPMGNGGLYTFSYIFLANNPVHGEMLLNRFYMAMVGFALCGIVLWRNHKNQNKDIRFIKILKDFSLYSYKCQWQLRLALGITLLLTLFSSLHMERFMWAGFACGSLLSDSNPENNIHEKFTDRLLGVLIGCAAFYIVYTILPQSLYPLVGPVGGLCLGLSTEYRRKTAINCFGALMLAAGMYGLGHAVLMRIGWTILGVVFAMIFFYLYDRFILNKFLPQKSQERQEADEKRRQNHRNWKA